MAKIAITSDNGSTVYAEKAIPDTALPKIRTVYGGTNAQAAAKALETATRAIRHEVREGLEAAERNTANATLAATIAAINASFESTDWPE